jgi:hypothetical protein
MASPGRRPLAGILSPGVGAAPKAAAEQKRVESFDPKMGAQIAHDIRLR